MSVKRGGRVSTIPAEEIVALYNSGVSVYRIARDLGRAYSTVWKWLARRGFHTRRMRERRAIETALKIATANPASPHPHDDTDMRGRGSGRWPSHGQIHPKIEEALRLIPQPWPTTRELAKKAGYADSTIRHWLYGRRRPSEEALADFLQTLALYAEGNLA